MQLERIEEVPFEADFSQDAMQLLEIKRDAMLLATPRTSPISMENESKSDTKSFRQKFGKGTAAKKVLGGTPQTPPLSDGPKTKRAQVKNACVNCQRACKKCDDCRPCQRCVRYHLEESCQNSARRERKRGVRRGPYKRRSSSTILLDSLQERRRSQSVPPDGRLHFPETSENPIFRALTAFERSEMFPQGTPSPFHTMVDSQLHNSFPSDSAGIVEQSHNFQSFLPHDISFYTAHKSPVVSITHSASQGSMSPVDTGGRMLYSPLPIKLHYSESLERSPRRLFQYPDGTVRSLKNFSAMDFEGSSLNEARGTNRMAFHTPTPVKLSSILPLAFSNSPCPTSDICATRSLMLEQPSYTVISDFSENPQCSLSALSELCTSELVSGTQYAPKNPQISTNELSSL